jgi:hypothetical protein
MLVSLLLTAPLVLQTCADCALVRERVLPCTRHLEEERAAFSDAQKQLDSKLAAERIADSLADESREVRDHAASLLGPPQHAILSMQLSSRPCPRRRRS